MSRECFSALMLHQLNIPHTSVLEQTYYRSKLFTQPSTTNPLLAAANPLFSILERFSSTQALPPVQLMRDNIDHEWQAFRSNLSSLKYLQECIVVAEYLMSSTLDELLGKTYLRVEGKAVEFIAFTPSSLNDQSTQSHFFELIQHMKERANQYLDLLELAYYCLISGYEGELHMKADGRQTLDNLIQELYELILRHRAPKPIKLFKEPPQITPILTQPLPIRLPWKPATIGLLCLIGLYFGGQYTLDQQAKTLLDHSTQPFIRKAN
jgi:type IV/VI secretion system ImpK/VasF family protein